MNETLEPDFLRRYHCTVADCVWDAEFDSGFLAPARRVNHAHNHAGIELIAVQSGISGILTAEHAYELTSSELLLIPSGMYHANDLDKQQGERFCFRLYPPDIRRSTNPLAVLLTGMTEPMRFSLPEVLPVLAEIRREMRENLVSSEDMIHALLEQCFVYLLRWASQDVVLSAEKTAHSRQKEPEEVRLKKIDFFFSRRYMQPVTLEELAEYLHISPTHANRVLRSHYGRSFLEKLRDTRLNQARILLEQSPYSVNRIAQEVGYVSIAGFYHAFRQTFGMTPMAYKKKKSNGNGQ